MSSFSHIPVMLPTILSFFEGRQLKSYCDGTLGLGGHAKAMLEHHPEIEVFWGVDRDPKALEIAQKVLEPWKDKLKFCHGSFRHLKELVKEPVDGILLDLGVSSMQLDDPERGFSLYHEGPLDMRMDPDSSLTAAEIVNRYSERELGRIFLEYGEEPRWKRAAHAIVEARKKKKIHTTADLGAVLKPVLTWGGRKGRNIHPFTLIFQALRIAVNEELQTLEEGILEAIDLLKPQGRLGIISFHSLEDGRVKNSFRKAFQEDKVQLLTKKPLLPSFEEIKQNPRSRSAKLRFVEKVA